MKGKEKRSNRCTYCGSDTKLTSDHVIPRALWIGESPERPITARSCPDCNWKSDESLLKSFMTLFDERFSEGRARELAHPKGRGDLRKLLSLSYADSGRQPEELLALVQGWRASPVYPDEKITRLFTKMFQGLRRYLLKSQWVYLPATRFQLFTLRQNGDYYNVFELPLPVGGREKSMELPLLSEDFVFEARFRDFRFGRISTQLLGLRYENRSEGNELFLICLEQLAEDAGTSD